MRCLNCSRGGLAKETQVCPGCGVHLPSFMRDVLPEGTELHGGKYHIEDALGWGGFGITYIGRHVSLNQTVAIKEFFPREHAVRDATTGGVSIGFAEKESVERALKRFVREGQTLAIVNHPGVVRVRDHFEEHGTAYLVMDLVAPAQTLRELLDSRPDRRLPLDEVEKIAAQLTDALDAVHEKGVYHLDIKPDNVLITSRGQAVLVDFGAARQGLSSRSTQAYTLEYAAPEVLAGEDVGPESDIFELGMMLHEMLTGERPPSALSRLLKDTWKPLNVPAAWDTLITSALKMKKEERPRSVGEWWQQGQAAKSKEKKKEQTTQQQEQYDQSGQEQEQKAEPKQKRERKQKPPPKVEEPVEPPTLRLTDAELLDQVKYLIRAGQKVEAVKLYREVKGCGLKEAKDRVEAIERELQQKQPKQGKEEAKKARPKQEPVARLIVTGEYGDAIYGDEKKDIYYGRVSQGAELDLLDRKTYKDKFGLDIIKVKVLTNKWPDQIGKIGWVTAASTNYAYVIGGSQQSEQEGKAKAEPKREAVVRLVVTGEYGDAFYGDESAYKKDVYYGRVGKGAELELLDRKPYKDEFNQDIIKVRVLTNKWPQEVGKIGWVTAKVTNYASVVGGAQQHAKPEESTIPKSQVGEHVRRLLKAGRRAEAIALYRKVMEAGEREAESFVASIEKELKPPEPKTEKKSEPILPTPPAADQKPATAAATGSSTGCLVLIGLIVGAIVIYNLIPSTKSSSSNFNRATPTPANTPNNPTSGGPPLGSWTSTPQPPSVIGPGAGSTSSSSYSGTVTLHVQVLDSLSRPNAPPDYAGLQGATISFQAGGKSFTATADSAGYATFSNVPCNTAITLHIRYKSHSEDWPQSASDIPCGQAAVTLSDLVVGLNWTGN